MKMNEYASNDTSTAGTSTCTTRMNIPIPAFPGNLILVLQLYS